MTVHERECHEKRALKNKNRNSLSLWKLSCLSLGSVMRKVFVLTGLWKTVRLPCVRAMGISAENRFHGCCFKAFAAARFVRWMSYLWAVIHSSLSVFLGI
ncbi:hypothetical protein NPIL_415351 [Nephila pilipes]|uniref:Uncharacterized protein n=1 Tax=Nephila pilipes TaxID=299642 RepID=A0A8X6QX91_NEPPI|nr:hypothetical protein NPIL_415351 [Nephila pilipes]